MTEEMQFDIEKTDENDPEKNLFIEFAEKWVTCALPKKDEDPELYNRVISSQMHDHKPTCKKKKSFCRFNFPRFPSKKNLIAKPLDDLDMEESKRDEILKKAQEILQTVKDNLILLDRKKISYDDCGGDDEQAIHKFITVTCGISNYDDYEKALQISERGKVLILKRSVAERNVNNYQPTFLKAWNANLDVQLCIDAHAVVTYITDYFSKGDAGFTQLLKKAIKDTKGQDRKSRLNEFKKLYFTYRQVCAAEAAYRLIPAMHVKFSNIHVVFLTTGFPKHRICIAKKVSDKNATEANEELGDEDDEVTKEAEKETFTIEGREGEYTEPVTMHEKYAGRPVALEKMCLAQFVVSYEVCHRIKDDVFGDNVDFSEETGDLKDYTTGKELPLYIRLRDGKTKMRLRRSQQVLRIHASRHKKTNHEQTYSELLLFLPWFDEAELFADPDDENKCKQLYLDKKEIIETNRKKIFPFAKTIEVLYDMAEAEERPAHIYDNLDPEGQQDNLECEEQMEPLDTSELPDEPTNPPQMNAKNRASRKESCIVKPIELGTDEQMLQDARSLSFEQKVVFNMYIDFIKKIIIKETGKPIDIDAPQLKITGKKCKVYFYKILFLLSNISFLNFRWRRLW